MESFLKMPSVVRGQEYDVTLPRKKPCCFILNELEERERLPVCLRVGAKLHHLFFTVRL